MTATGCGGSAPPRPTVTVVSESRHLRPSVRAVAADPDLPVRLRLARPPDATPARPPDVSASIARARRSYVEGDLEACEQLLSDQEQLMALLRSGRRSSAARILFWRLACRVAAGDRAAAEAIAEDFASLGLDVPPDADAASVEVEAQLERAIERMATATPRRLTVTSRPEGAEILVDGRRTTCVTPCTLRLRPGLHVLELRAPGRVPFARSLRLEADIELEPVELAEADPTLAARQYAALDPRSRADDPVAIRLLATALRAPRLLQLVSIPGAPAGGELRATLAVDSAVRARARRPFDEDGDINQQVRQVLLDALVRGGVVDPVELWEEPWFWLSVAAAVLVAGGIVFAAMYEPPVEVRASF